MATIESYRKKADPKKVYYLVRYRKPDHKQTTKRGFATKKAAEAFAATVEVSKLRNEYIDPTRSKITVGELGPDWLRRKSHLKPSSLRPLEISWRVHVEPTWGNVRVADVEHTAVQDWATALGETKQGTTVKRAFGVLSAILEEAVRDRRVLANPCAGVTTRRKTPKRRVYLDHKQVHALAAESGDRELVVLVLAYTGLRWGEMAALRVQDVDLVRRRLTVNENAVEVGNKMLIGSPKTHELRWVPYPQFMHDKMIRQCAAKLPAALLFPGHDGEVMRRTRTDTKSGGWFVGAIRRSGVPHITPHDLRHTAASLAVQAGAHVKVVQRMLGHKSAAMTLDTYADLFEDDLDDVAAAMDTAASRFIT